MNTKTDDGFDIFDPSHFAPLVVFLASDAARNINGELFRAIGDKIWVYSGWRVVKKISNNWKPFTPKQIAERIELELLKDLPDKLEGATTPEEIFSQ